MVKKHGFIGEFITTTVSGFSKLSNTLKVFAQETDNPPNQGGEEGDSSKGTTKTPEPSVKTVNYEDLIAKARKEEKDKLYPKIQSLETEVDTWVKKCNVHLVTVEKKDREILELQEKLKTEGKDDSEQIKALKNEVESLKEALEKAKKDIPDVNAIEEKIKSEYEVKLYREQKLREVGDEIIPELVTGLTVEEIDTSLEVAKKRFKDMSEKILGKKSNTSFVPPANTSTSKMDVNKFTMADLANLDPRSAEYKEFRKNMGLK